MTEDIFQAVRSMWNAIPMEQREFASRHALDYLRAQKVRQSPDYDPGGDRYEADPRQEREDHLMFCLKQLVSAARKYDETKTWSAEDIALAALFRN